MSLAKVGKYKVDEEGPLFLESWESPRWFGEELYAEQKCSQHAPLLTTHLDLMTPGHPRFLHEMDPDTA